MIGALDAIAMPWTFTQSGPLDTKDLLESLSSRGLRVAPPGLQHLYRSGALVPLVELTDDPIRSRLDLSSTDPRPMGTRHADLRTALAEGRIRDLHSSPYDELVRFDQRQIEEPRGWWNGLFYSRWQLLAVPELQGVARGLHEPPPTETLRLLAAWVPVLVAIEARYLPTVEPAWLSVSGAELEEWEDFRTTYDPVAARHDLDVDPAECLAFAELLLRRARGIDPTGKWSQLIRRAPRKSWETLTGDALVAMDHRVAAEMLLLFYEDLADRSPSPHLEPLPPLPAVNGRFWEPRIERLSFRSEEHLDRVLSGLGVSPHPGAVVVVEGETEHALLRRVFDHFAWSRSPDQVQIICMRGADKNLALVGAAIAAPLLGAAQGSDYAMIRPPTKLLIVIDRDDRWVTEKKVEQNRQKVVDEIERVVVAQGVRVDRADLDGLVAVEQWDAKCFEFAHFTDDELADALMAEPGRPSHLRRSELTARLAAVRAKGEDVKHAWHHTWIPKPSKPKLADRMWPLLRRKIEDARWDPDLEMPPIVEAAHRAHLMAQRPPTGTWTVTALPIADTQDDARS